MNDITYYQQKAQRIGAQIRHEAKAGEKIHLSIDDEEVPEDLVLNLNDWIHDNTNQEPRTIIMANDGSGFVFATFTAQPLATLG